MTVGRRELVVGMAAMALGNPASSAAQEAGPMYGLIGKMTATPGKRESLIGLLLEGTGDMPGCLSYIIAKDPADQDSIWITEVWDTAESHKASLSLPAVQKAIAAARPMIAGFSNRQETVPVGGSGLPAQARTA